MTENEALRELKLQSQVLKSRIRCNREIEEFVSTAVLEYRKDAVDMAIQALEEIQQYRAMEEKLNGISVEQVVNGFINVTEDRTDEGYERGRILTNTEADMWNEYRAIGTIEEFKALKESVYVDERPFIFVCPNCEENYTLEQDERPSCCRKCNEKIDWNKVIFYQL